ncbi:hypothetical protein BASA50_001936 [Batrachochytrium salamandrivorans]|uniref:SRR1-like domain-containing protein n=1 Tax=Batrachochytrium salamandrivorans TaxID=1357716 RepID=A0ABQ8FNZ5_9FUNG|nr:hypothetical protein BASA50_001936 [Batrachochytrium salamandrivorans]
MFNRPNTLPEEIVFDSAWSEIVFDSNLECSYMDQDGFTIVLPRRNRQSQRSSILNEQSGLSIPNHPHKTYSNRKRLTASHKIQTMSATQSGEEPLPANFQTIMSHRIESVGSDSPPNHMIDTIKMPLAAFRGSSEDLDCVCYGLGSISDSKLSQFQLALLILMMKEFKHGQRSINKKTLFYMPHCQDVLYNNVLKANWGSDRICNIAIIGNSFEAYDCNTIGKSLAQKCPFIADALSLDLVDETAFTDFGPCSRAFNNTAFLAFAAK